jgi:hypothetical protein
MFKASIISLVVLPLTATCALAQEYHDIRSPLCRPKS